MRWPALAGVFGFAVLARWLASPGHNIAEDPFVIVESAKHLLTTGLYRIPSIGLASGEIAWTMPSWPAGFPVLLVALFKVFGPSEAVARACTIVVSGLLPPITAWLAYQISNRARVALLAGLVAALHPLAVAFAGQIFTNNISVTLFAAWLAVLVTATVDRAHGRFVTLGAVVAAPWRRRAVVGAALLFGLGLSVRDTDVILAGPLVYVLFRIGAFRPSTLAAHWRALTALGALAAVAFVIGWGPGWYFNVVNFGSPFVSTHYQTNIRLSPEYLVGGSRAFFGLPGLAVMAIAIAVFQSPVLLAFATLRRQAEPLWRAVAAMAALIALPLLLVNGAFPVASNGAAPRYVLPLVPFAAVFSAWALERALTRPRRVAAAVLAGGVIVWQALLFYPPSALFEAWTRFAYLAYYSPVYVARPYRNYPDHTRPMVQWVADHTPLDAVIATPSRAQHFYYYGRRAVVVFDPPEVGDWIQHVDVRPLYLVEDRVLAARPDLLTKLRENLHAQSLKLSVVGHVSVFTPEAGLIDVRIYSVTREDR